MKQLQLKKYVTLFFLMLVNVVMLGFTIIPHHHHEQYICFNLNHCSQNHPVHSQSHSHDEENGSCVNHLFQTQVNRQGNNSEHQENNDHLSFSSLFLDSERIELHIELLAGKLLATIPYKEKLHSELYLSIQAGRAPPVQA